MPIVSIVTPGIGGSSFIREKMVPHLPRDFEDRVTAFFDALHPGSVSSPKPAVSDWKEAAETIDRFRDRISAYYGFERALIEPVYIADPTDMLKDCAFDVLGIGYEVEHGTLACTGEVASREC